MRLLLAATAFLACLAPARLRPAAADDREQFFESRVRPILAGICFRCHGETKTAGALRVDQRGHLLRGGESGPALVPGQPDQSRLIQAVRREDGVSAMPPGKQQALRPDQVADLAEWVRAGAYWPERTARFSAAGHWAFRPLSDPPLPQVADRAWPQTSVDRFILARHEAAGLRPAPPAAPAQLIRRVTFDLTGLPPAAGDVQAFVADPSPAAYAALVERLLASPAYGERWGRHWLDAVRYADTAGETADYPVPDAWRYRNYVIASFNSDKPFDQFLREQIAGDVLALGGPAERYAEQVVATGFLAISRRFGFDSENYHHLTIQDSIDTLGQVVLGLSLGCARCHDHKFDPVSMRDYYALYGIFASSRYAFPGSEQKQKLRALVPLVPPDQAHAQWRAYQQRLSALAARLSRNQRAVPAAALLSLAELDGDFELQAPAAGGSQGVLVPPWHYSGPVALTAAAQSPLPGPYAPGRVGVSIAPGHGDYSITQTFPSTLLGSDWTTAHCSLDFRLGAPAASSGGGHRLLLAAGTGKALVEVRISARAVALQLGAEVDELAPVQPGHWCQLRLAVDRQRRTVTAVVQGPGGTSPPLVRPLVEQGSLDLARLALQGEALPGEQLPAIELDNLAIHSGPFPATAAPAGDEPTTASLTAELQALVGLDGDFELQRAGGPPAAPWGPGPQSVVSVSDRSQSPFRNLAPPGTLGLHLPNRQEYDGFGQSLARRVPENQQRLFAGFEFRCGEQSAGSEGSWRYYLGHGPGTSAAVELFFNGQQFFRRSGGAVEPVGPLAAGQWHQVRLALDLPAKTYAGVLATAAGEVPFSGALAAGWDGTIDYLFIDSYGHVPGVRPALDADNFYLGDSAPGPLDAPAAAVPPAALAARRAARDAAQTRLAEHAASLEQDERELAALVERGPFEMAYAVAEGTPHDARLQLRGEPLQAADPVPRGLLTALGGGPLPAETAGSGRRELAEWLTRSDHPLPARVLVNRIWQHHFGRGLVPTPNDFGVRGQPPSDPLLLDHLAGVLIGEGWSIKALQRLILHSAVYQQSSVPRAAGTAGAELYTAFPRRRLAAEEIRDALLQVCGQLDRRPAREHPFPSPLGWSYTQHAPFTAVYDHGQRSVYLMTQRLKRHPFLALFDGPDPNATTPQRLLTTVPTQALYFLNDPFVHAQADHWASRLLAAEGDPAARLDLAYWQALARGATAADQAQAAEFLGRYRAELSAADAEPRAWAALLRSLLSSNEFIHVE